MAAAKTKKSFKGKWLLYGILLLVLLVVGFKIYNHFSIASNKQAFQNARSTIDAIYYDSIKQIGPADNAKIGSSCSRSHEEFGKGELTCDLNTDFIYSVNDESEANTFFQRIQTLVKESKNFKPTKTLSSSIKDSLVVNSSYHVASDTYRAYGLNCTINYIYDTSREIDLSIKNTSEKPFEITIGCYGPAKQQYYRLAS